MQKPTLLHYWTTIALFAIVFVATVTGVVFNISTVSTVKAKIAQQKEEQRPANLEVTVIADSRCPDCFDVEKVLTGMEQLNVKITRKNPVDGASDEGKKLIEKYQIKKLPTFLLEGELNKGNELKTALANLGVTQNNVFVYEPSGGPYVLATTGEIKGRTQLTLIADTACDQCYDVTQHELILQQFGLDPASKVVDVKSALGQSFIKAYAIKMVPTFVLTGEVNEYPSLASVWSQVGFVARDGAYVFSQGVPLMGVYRDLTTNKIVSPSAQ